VFDVIPAWIPQGGAVGLLLLAMWLVLTGRIVARSTMDQMRTDLSVWRTVAENSQNTLSELTGHFGRLVTTTDKIVEQQGETQRLLREVLATRRGTANQGGVA
jgi:hypothetical protein